MKNLSNFEVVKDKVDLLEYIERDTSLKRSGKTWIGLCPIHQEKTPSFVVYPETQSFHCFGCGAHGTIIDYVMNINDIRSPSEALEMIAREKNILLESVDH